VIIAIIVLLLYSIIIFTTPIIKGSKLQNAKTLNLSRNMSKFAAQSGSSFLNTVLQPATNVFVA